jgi:FMN phosphatase YigB (HAD superfamily)
MARKKLVVCDFDGMLTDVEFEAVPCVDYQIELAAKLLGQPPMDVMARASEITRDLINDPGRTDWMYADAKGIPRAVAPAMVDPLLRVKPVIEKLLAGYELHKEFMQNLSQLLYELGYPKCEIRFRPHARHLLEAVARSADLSIITNSGTEAVSAKLGYLFAPRTHEAVDDFNPFALVDAFRDRVQGGAKKYFTDPDFDLVPEELEVPGHHRPVLLRRPRYFDALETARDKTGVSSWEDVTVIGDIFELDLALPLALGARVGLTVGPYTPPYEIEFLKNHPRGAVLSDLKEAEAFALG